MSNDRFQAVDFLIRQLTSLNVLWPYATIDQLMLPAYSVYNSFGVGTESQLQVVIHDEIDNNIDERPASTRKKCKELHFAIQVYLNGYHNRADEILAFDFASFSHEQAQQLSNHIEHESARKNALTDVDTNQWMESYKRLSELKKEQPFVGLYGVNLFSAIRFLLNNVILRGA